MPTRPCTVEGCEKAYLAKGLCGSHYEQAHRKKDCDNPECGVRVSNRAKFCKPCSKVIQARESALIKLSPTRVCSVCGEEKTPEQVDATRWRRSATKIVCNVCVGVLRIAKRSEVSYQETVAFLDAQPRSCTICGREDTLVVDHCHTSGALRGILCRECNSVLGLARDSADILEQAAMYLRKFEHLKLSPASTREGA